MRTALIICLLLLIVCISNQAQSYTSIKLLDAPPLRSSAWYAHYSFPEQKMFINIPDMQIPVTQNANRYYRRSRSMIIFTVALIALSTYAKKKEERNLGTALGTGALITASCGLYFTIKGNKISKRLKNG